jgi:CubicO group peptidase (beta-lactamase class C family)
VTDVQTTVQSLLDELVAGGGEHGLQVAAYHHGDLVVDAWAGVADTTSEEPVGGDTLFTVYSVSKGITATAVHILAERGSLAYDDPIAEHWPEFAQHGKDGILVRHAMSHTAGLPQMPPSYGSYDVTDWPGMCGRLAAQPPLFPPGQTIVYHALTYGWIVGGTAERADGRPFARIVAEEIAAPLGLDGLFFGAPEGDLDRVATLTEASELLDVPPAPTAIPDIAPPDSLADATMNRVEMRRACLPAYGLCANARSLAKAYAALIGDGVDGVCLLPPKRVRAATSVQAEGLDASSGLPACFGLGYGLGGPESVVGPRRTAFGHGGYGGAHGFADPEYGLAVGLTKNRLTMNVPFENTTWRIVHAIREGLGIPDAA